MLFDHDVGCNKVNNKQNINKFYIYNSNNMFSKKFKKS
jgi:hypothetical protein